MCLFSHPPSDGGKPSLLQVKQVQLPQPLLAGQVLQPQPWWPSTELVPVCQQPCRRIETGGGDDTPGHSMWSRRALTSAKQKRIITFFRATGCCCLCWLWSDCCLPTSPQPLQQSCHRDRQLPARICAGCPPSLPTGRMFVPVKFQKNFMLACSLSLPRSFWTGAQP